MTSSDNDDFEEKIPTANLNISTPEFLENRRLTKNYNNNTTLTGQPIYFTTVSHLQNMVRATAFWCKHGRVKISC
jgi:hypothetical protein